ncbi:MAG: hypothetical protein IT435_19475 [Phycisphaerales bacterium]|nr:hypothetical protein [Phycisphaerales bacterium]
MSLRALVAHSLLPAICCGLFLGCSTSHHSRPSEQPCAVNRVPIVLTTPAEPETGEIGGMVVPVERDGRLGSLAIDTGSALTFLYLGRDGAEYIPLAGRIRIGCEMLDLPGRNFEADPPEPGERPAPPIIGVLGADFLIDALTDFDPVRQTITRYNQGKPVDADWDRWTAVPYDNVRDHILIHIAIDGKPKRLMWDTGAPHVLLIGEQGQPGDQKSEAQDVMGGRFPMFLGAALVGIGDEPAASKPVLRAPRFPYFEGTVEALGGNIDGLAGQSLFGHRRIVFDPASGMLRIAPAR